MQNTMVYAKLVVAVGLVAWVVVSRLGGEDGLDSLTRAVEGVEDRVSGRSLSDIEKEISALEGALRGLEARLGALGGVPAMAAATEATPEVARPNRRKISAQLRPGSSRPQLNPTTKRARAQVNVMEKHIEGLSKRQLADLTKIFSEMHNQEQKELARLQGQPNVGQRFGPIRESLLIERYTRIREVLTPAQAADLENVPIPIIPPSFKGDGR